MSTRDKNDNSKGDSVLPENETMSRRKFLGTAAFVGLSGAGLSVGLSSCNKEGGKSAALGQGEKAGELSAEVHPGQHVRLGCDQ